MIIKNESDDLKVFDDKFIGIYRGVVEDNNPTDENGAPYKDGRVRIRVFGLHTPEKTGSGVNKIPTSHLPLAEPVLSLFEGSISGHGCWTVPLQGSHVMCFFENGNINQLRYFGTVPGIPVNPPDKTKGFNDPSGTFPEKDRLNEPDLNRLAREVTDDTQIQHIRDNLIKSVYKATGHTWDEPAPSYEAEYPHNIVLNTHEGMLVEIDSTPDKERYHVYHPSNTYMEINKDGRVIIRNASDKYEIVCGNKNIQISFSEHKTVTGDKTERVFGEEIDEVSNNVTITIGNNRDESVGGNYTLNVNGIVHVSATEIHLNTRAKSIRGVSGSPVRCSASIYTEVDYGNMDDEPAVDDGLNIYPPNYNPTPEDIARSESLDVSPTKTSRTDNDTAKEPEAHTELDYSDITSDPAPTTQLSDNYQLKDLTTDTALSNYKLKDQAGLTKKEIAENLRDTSENVLEPLAEKYGKDSFVVTSGFRHGSGSSQHEKGQAVDIQFPNKTNAEVYEIAKEMKESGNYDQLILEYGPNKPWIHVSYNKDGNRSASASNKFGTRTKAGTYEWGVLKDMS